jgi:transcriptional regulator with XRE-family HTH domain
MFNHNIMQPFNIFTNFIYNFNTKILIFLALFIILAKIFFMDELLGCNIKYLRKTKGITQDVLADKIGVNRAMIGSYEEGRAIPKLSAMRMLAHYFNVSIDDLINANLSDRENKSTSTDSKGSGLRILNTIVDRNNQELITLVPVKASAGYLNGYADPDYVENLPQFTLPLPELSKERTYRAFQIKGDSMEPIPSGSYIIGEYLQNWNDIKEGKPYVLLTRDEGVVYKRVYKQSNDVLLLKSDNPQYEPFAVGVDSIVEVWKALGYICLSLPEPDEMSMAKLTSMFHEMKKEVETLKKEKT